MKRVFPPSRLIFYFGGPTTAHLCFVSRFIHSVVQTVGSIIADIFNSGMIHFKRFMVRQVTWVPRRRVMAPPQATGGADQLQLGNTEPRDTTYIAMYTRTLR
jgi:hypothetical protein